jgi:exodeoxyribonuclease-1
LALSDISKQAIERALEEYNGNVIAFNLAHDPAELLSVGEASLRKWAATRPKPLRTIKANSSPILLDIEIARDRADLMKIGEAEIMRRAQLLQSSPELRHRLLQAYVATRQVYEESPMTEEQIYWDFPGSSDTALMREFHRASWPGRSEIAEQFEDDRYRRIARRIVFNHRPDLLPEETCKVFSSAIARRWLAEGKPRWFTIDRALGEIEERREGCSYEEALLLERMEAYFRDREAWARSQLEE